MQQQAGATSWREGGCCCLSGLRLGVAFYCYPLGQKARRVNPLKSPEERIVGRSRRVTMLGYRAYYFSYEPTLHTHFYVHADTRDVRNAT